MKEYIPNPVDTGHIQLPKELEYLVEEMAKNVHEVWSKTRIEQGWTYGKKRDDVLKQHPCLVPYEELPEEEKVYDRNSSVETPLPENASRCCVASANMPLIYA